MMNPAALYIRQSDVCAAAPVPDTLAPSLNEGGTISTTIYGITAHASVFALHLSLRVTSAAQEHMFFTPAIADGVSLSIVYSNGASVVEELGSHNVGKGIVVAKMESCTTKTRIDAHMAVAPLPSPGDVHICLAMGDGSMLGEWLLRGETILKASRAVMGCDEA